MKFLIILEILFLAYIFISSFYHTIVKEENQYEEMKQKELHNKSEPTNKNS